MAGTSASTDTKSNGKALEKRDEQAARVIDQSFPADVDKDEHDGEKYFCGDVYRVDEKGNPELIFAIYPEFPGRFLALKRRADGSYSAQDVAPTGFKPWSIYCDMSTAKINLRGDEVIEVSLRSMSRFTSTFLFQWDGAQLTSIGPAEISDDELSTDVQNGRFENIYGGDSFALVSIDEDDNEPYSMYESIYTLENGRYVLKTHSSYSDRLAVGPSKSLTSTTEFSLADESQGPYAIQIANGDLDGTHRVSGVEISLDGKRVVSQGEINGQIGTYHVDAINPLKRAGNSLTVKLTGAPGAYINLFIEDRKAETGQN